MRDYIKKNKEKIRYIYVYALDRFSHTIGAAIKLKNDLREEYGVLADAVTQPAEATIGTPTIHNGHVCYFLNGIGRYNDLLIFVSLLTEPIRND